MPIAVLLAAALVLIAVPEAAFGQAASTGTISGTVTDETGARLPGVSVQAQSPVHIRTESAVSDAQGRFRLGGLTPGLYQLMAELAGFTTVIQEGVRVEVGREFSFEISMRVAAVAEVVTVIGESPTVDTKSSTKVTNMSYEFLQSIPPPRSGTGAEIFRLAPGVDASSSVAGSPGSGTAWVFDGVDVSDPGGGGQFPFQNYDYIEEAEVITIGAPAEYGKFTGAIFNVVTKGGGTTYSGSGNVFYTGGGLVGDNIEEVNDEFASNPNFSPLEADEIDKRWDMTFQVGGPVVPNKFHFFGSFQQIVDDTTEAGTSDVRTDRSTRLLAKGNWSVNGQNRINFFYEYDRFPIDGRVAGGFLNPDPNAAVKEPSPNTTPRVHWQYTPNDNTILEVQYSGFYGFFDLEPRNDLPSVLDFGPYAIYQSYYGFYHFGRARSQINADYTQYVDDFAGNHEIKFGMSWENGETDDIAEYGKNSLGQNVLYYAYFGEIYGGDTRLGDQLNTTLNKVWSFYLRDSWTIADRLTLNLGVRYDRSTAHFSTPGEDAFTFNAVAPRLFATLDVTGEGTTVIKGGYGRYYNALFGNLYDNFDPSLPTRAFFVFNSGAGGCGQAVPGFPNVGGGPECFMGIDSPNVDVVSLRDPNSTIGIDPDLKNHYTDQFAISLEHELMSDLSVSGTFIKKLDGNLYGGVDDRSVYVPTTIDDPQGGTLNVFERVSPAADVLEILTNVDDFGFERNYTGFELGIRKRFRDNWQFNASWTIQKAEGTHDNDTDSGTRFDGANPNDFVNFDGELENSRRHVLKLQGSYRVPVADVLVGVLWGTQSGRPYNRVVRARLPGRVDILAEPRGDRRRDTLNELDLRLEKVFRLGGTELGVLVDMYNLLNESTVVTVNETTGASFELPISVVEPRKLQVGLRYRF